MWWWRRLRDKEIFHNSILSPVKKVYFPIWICFPKEKKFIRTFRKSVKYSFEYELYYKSILIKITIGFLSSTNYMILENIHDKFYLSITLLLGGERRGSIGCSCGGGGGSKGGSTIIVLPMLPPPPLLPLLPPLIVFPLV